MAYRTNQRDEVDAKAQTIPLSRRIVLIRTARVAPGGSLRLGDQNLDSLQRLYGIAFLNDKLLKDAPHFVVGDTWRLGFSLILAVSEIGVQTKGRPLALRIGLLGSFPQFHHAVPNTR